MTVLCSAIGTLNSTHTDLKVLSWILQLVLELPTNRKSYSTFTMPAFSTFFCIIHLIASEKAENMAHEDFSPWARLCNNNILIPTGNP